MEKQKFVKWISVKDRLPEIDGDYLCYVKNDVPYISNVQVIEYVEGIGFSWEGYEPDEDVTHWMPLPEPPKGE